jgi:hypothetical protein
MSQPFSRYLHPFDEAHHPSPEPEVKHAILASWVRKSNALEIGSAGRRLPEPERSETARELFPAKGSIYGTHGRRPSL